MICVKVINHDNLIWLKLIDFFFTVFELMGAVHEHSVSGESCSKCGGSKTLVQERVLLTLPNHQSPDTMTLMPHNPGR